MTEHSQKHSNCHDVIEDWLTFHSHSQVVSRFSILTEYIFLRKIILSVYVAAHETWDLFCLLSGLTCKYRNLLLSKSPCAHRQTRWHSSSPSHKYGCLLCSGLRLLCPLHSRYALLVFFFFLPQFQFLYVASCLCVAEAAHAFVL